MKLTKEELFEKLWKYMGGTYTREVEKRKSKYYPKKSKWVTVYTQLRKKQLKNLFQVMNIQEVKESGRKYTEDEYFYTLDCHMSFIAKIDKEWRRSGWAFCDLMINEDITDEEVKIIQEWTKEVDDYFKSKLVAS